MFTEIHFEEIRGTCIVKLGPSDLAAFYYRYFGRVVCFGGWLLSGDKKSVPYMD